MVPTRKLQVIPKPAEGTRSVLAKAPPDPLLFQGEGDLNLLCGKCGAILAKGVHEGTLINLVLQCNQCGTYNEV